MLKTEHCVVLFPFSQPPDDANNRLDETSPRQDASEDKTSSTERLANDQLG